MDQSNIELLKDNFSYHKPICFEYAYKRVCKLSGMDRFYELSNMDLDMYKRRFMRKMTVFYGVEYEDAFIDMEEWIRLNIPRREWRDLTYESGAQDAQESYSYWSE